MSSLLMDSIDVRTTSGFACYHLSWKAYKIGKIMVWYDIISLGQHKRYNDVWRRMLAWKFGSTHGRMTSGVA